MVYSTVGSGIRMTVWTWSSTNMRTLLVSLIREVIGTLREVNRITSRKSTCTARKVACRKQKCRKDLVQLKGLGTRRAQTQRKEYWCGGHTKAHCSQSRGHLLSCPFMLYTTCARERMSVTCDTELTIEAGKSC
jgi:hypothetical protein